MSKIRMKNVLAGALSAAMIFGAAGCAVRESDGEKIDESRTQLYVFNYGGGFGNDWVKALKTSFEELHAEDVYEEGKKGVQVMIDSKKQSFTAADIKSSLYDVFFTESVNYYNLVGASDGASALLDVTDALKKPLSDLDADDTQSVLDKFYDEQLAYYGVDRGDGNPRYYGVPHYAGYWGIIYNVDLFENRGYYFLDDQSDFEESGMLEDRFINTNAPVKQKRSAGPDGEYNTSDDGLPATYEEFFALCDYIVTDKVLPLRWTGANYKDYLNTFSYTLAVDFEGKENIMRNYTLSGTANNLGTATDSGFSKDGETTEINAGNGYELARGEGWYHAASFLRNLCLNDNAHNNYHNHNAFNGGYSHMTAQQDFLYGGKDGGKTEEAAMLIDGVWWQMEADQTFKDMVNFYGEDCSAQNRKFGYMPLPKIKGEQKQFRELTTGNVVIMGRKSYEEIGHPLPNRMNIVVSTTTEYQGDNLVSVKSLEDALLLAKGRDVYISGGYGLFKEALQIVDKMYITEVDLNIEDGDTFFPEFDINDFEVLIGELIRS